MYAPAGIPHYASMFLNVGGFNATKAAWTMKLFKNGAYVTNIPVNFANPLLHFFTFSFTDDGTHNCQWTLLVANASASTTYYTFDFFCAKPFIENGVTHIKSIVGNG